MLSKNTTDTLAAKLGINADELAQAISDEQEKDLELPEGRFLTKDNEDKLLDNHGKTRYDAGKSKALKDVFDGKTKEEYLEQYKSSILEDAKIEPNKKLSEKDKALKAMQDKYESDKKDWESKYGILETQLTGIKTKSEINKYLPNELPMGLTRDDATMIVANHLEFKEGQVLRNGEVLRDDYQNPLTQEQAVTSFVEERKWNVQKPTGRGAQKPNYNGAAPKNYEEFVQLCESKGIEPGSIEGKNLMKGYAEKNPEFFND
ncbi:MAG: hypothetical protein AAF039_12840 [Bacteroidota bacterium]